MTDFAKQEIRFTNKRASFIIIHKFGKLRAKWSKDQKEYSLGFLTDILRSCIESVHNGALDVFHKLLPTGCNECRRREYWFFPRWPFHSKDSLMIRWPLHSRSANANRMVITPIGLVNSFPNVSLKYHTYMESVQEIPRGQFKLKTVEHRGTSSATIHTQASESPKNLRAGQHGIVCKSQLRAEHTMRFS